MRNRIKNKIIIGNQDFKTEREELNDAKRIVITFYK